MKNGYNGNMNKLANKLLYGEVSNNGNTLNDQAINEPLAIPSVALALTGISEGLPYLPYLNDIWQGRGLLIHKPFNLMSSDEFKKYGNIGKRYYQKYLQNNPVYKRGFGLIEFGRTNKGKDSTFNMERYPFLRKNLSDSVEKLPPTNTKNEPDRVYRYLENTDNGSLYNYLIEDIENVGKRYKMMKNKTLGE